MTIKQRKAEAESMLIDARTVWMLCGLSKSSWYKNLSSGRIPRPVKIAARSAGGGWSLWSGSRQGVRRDPLGKP